MKIMVLDSNSSIYKNKKKPGTIFAKKFKKKSCDYNDIYRQRLLIIRIFQINFPLF